MIYTDEIPVEIWLYIFQLGCEIDEDPWVKMPAHDSKLPARMPPLMYLSITHMSGQLRRSREPQLKYFANKMAAVCRFWRSIVKDLPSDLWYIYLHVGLPELTGISEIEAELMAFPGPDIDLHFRDIEKTHWNPFLSRWQNTPFFSSSPSTTTTNSSSSVNAHCLERFMGMMAQFRSRIRLIEVTDANQKIIPVLNDWGKLANLECIGIRPSIADGLPFPTRFRAPSLRHVSYSCFSHQAIAEMQRTIWNIDGHPSTSTETNSTRRGPVIHIAGFDSIHRDVIDPSSPVLQNLTVLSFTGEPFRRFCSGLKSVELPALEMLQLIVSDFSIETYFKGFKTLPSLTTLLVKTRSMGDGINPTTSTISQYFHAPNLRRLLIMDESHSSQKGASVHLHSSLELGKDHGPSQLLINGQRGDFNLQSLQPLINYARITHLLLRTTEESRGFVNYLTPSLSRHTCVMPDLERLSLHRFNTRSVFESINFNPIATKLRKLDLGGSPHLESAKLAMTCLPNVSELSLEIRRVHDIRLAELLSEEEGNMDRDLLKGIRVEMPWKPKFMAHLEQLEIYWQGIISSTTLAGLRGKLLRLLTLRSQSTKPIKELILPPTHGFDATSLGRFKNLLAEVSFTATSPFADFEHDGKMDDYFRY